MATLCSVLKATKYNMENWKAILSFDSLKIILSARPRCCYEYRRMSSMKQALPSLNLQHGNISQIFGGGNNKLNCIINPLVMEISQSMSRQT